MKQLIAQAVLGTSVAMLAAPASAGWVTLNNPPATPVMTTCSGGTSTSDTCNVGTLSAATSGFSLVASTSGSIVANSVTVGTLYDRVYYNGSTGESLFALRLDMNGNQWDPPSTETFEVNDVFRSGFSSVTSIQAGYARDNPADEYSWAIGRTDEGLNEGTGSGGAPVYDTDWVRWWTDVNVDDPDGSSPGTSAWFVMKFADEDVVDFDVGTNAIRIWQGGEEGQEEYEIFMNGYVPVFASARSAMALAPVPEPSEYAMLLAGLGLVGVMARRRMR
jgi:hypothetical protein